MIESRVIEVASGLVLIYLMFSLLCSTINEWIARFLALRATGLRQGINELLNDGNELGLAASFHEHPLIKALKPAKAPFLLRRFSSADKSIYPSYISATTFALAVMDLAMDIKPPATGGSSGTAALKRDPKPAYASDVLPKILQDVDGDALAVRTRLEQWFNDSMDRVSGWYKRRIQVLIFCISGAVAFGFNVDTIRIARHLFNDQGSREALVKAADAVVEKNKASSLDTLQRNVSAFIDKAEASRVPLGRDCKLIPFRSDSCDFSLLGALGLVITTIALAQGAPFWFDTLNKLSNLRQTGKPPDQS